MAFLALLSIILYFFGFTTAAGITGIIFSILFLLSYFSALHIITLWAIIGVINNALLLSTKISYAYRLGISSAFSFIEMNLFFWLLILRSITLGGIFTTLKNKFKF